jgi:hypothetical protein
MTITPPTRPAPPAPPVLPTGREIRRWTRTRSRRHADTGVSALLGDIYTAFLSVAIAASMVLSLASGLAPDDGPLTRAPVEGPGLDGGWLAVLPALAATAALVGLVARLGPLALSAAESAWWLPLASERRSLLRPTAYRWPAVGLVLGALDGTMIALALGAEPRQIVAAAVLGATATIALVVLTGVVQTRPSWHRAVRRAADLLLAAVPVAGLVLAFGGWAPPPLTGAVVVAAAVATVLAVVLTGFWDRRLADVPGAGLRSQGAAADEALLAVLSLDPRGLGRALAARAEPSRRRRSSRMFWLARVPHRHRAAAALVTSDLLLFRRTPRHVVQVLLAACLPVLVLATPKPPTAVLAVTLVAAAYAAALGTAEGARRAQVNPALDAVLPLGQREVRRYRLVFPTAVMLLWAGFEASLLAWRYAGNPAGWVVLGLLVAPAWAAAGVRAAYRPLPDFSGPLVYSPMGSLPPGVSGIVTQGPDVALIGSVPLIVALILGRVPSLVLELQVVLTFAALAYASYLPQRPTAPKPSAG